MRKTEIEFDREEVELLIRALKMVVSDRRRSINFAMHMGEPGGDMEFWRNEIEESNRLIGELRKAQAELADTMQDTGFDYKRDTDRYATYTITGGKVVMKAGSYYTKNTSGDPLVSVVFLDTDGAYKMEEGRFLVPLDEWNRDKQPNCTDDGTDPEYVRGGEA